MKSRYEIRTEKLLKEQGYAVLDNGFPDFFISKNNEFGFVEVKSRLDHIRDNQEKLHNIFKKHGIPVSIVQYPLKNKKLPKIKTCKLSETMKEIISLYEGRIKYWKNIAENKCYFDHEKNCEFLKENFK